MKDELCVITTSRDRPLGIDLLSRWLRKQTDQNFKWVIATDGEQTRFPEEATVVRLKSGFYRSPNGRNVCKPLPVHSMLNNLRAGILAAPEAGGYVIAEDDEYYADGYVRVCRQGLARADLFGVAPSHYWHLGHRTYRNLHNVSFCALAATSFSAVVRPFVLDLIDQGDVYLDGLLWDRWQGSRLIEDNERLNLSFKGLPGSAGIGTSHSERAGGEDYGFERLKMLLPDKAAFKTYVDLVNEQRQATCLPSS